MAYQLLIAKCQLQVIVKALRSIDIEAELPPQVPENLDHENVKYLLGALELTLTFPEDDGKTTHGIAL
jgi:hypothetical protein